MVSLCLSCRRRGTELGHRRMYTISLYPSGDTCYRHNNSVISSKFPKTCNTKDQYRVVCKRQHGIDQAELDRYLTNPNRPSTINKPRQRHDTKGRKAPSVPCVDCRSVSPHYASYSQHHRNHRIAMKSAVAIISLVAAAVASPDPQITARAQLGKRQSDPALLGYVSTSGASSCKSSLPPTPSQMSSRCDTLTLRPLYLIEY